MDKTKAKRLYDDILRAGLAGWEAEEQAAVRTAILALLKDQIGDGRDRKLLYTDELEKD